MNYPAVRSTSGHAQAHKVTKQTTWASWIEAVTNTVVGFGIALAAQIIIFPWFGIHISIAASSGIAMIFLLISLIRGYFIRRLFEFMRVSGVLP